jgi:hypothetical protein
MANQNHHRKGVDTGAGYWQVKEQLTFQDAKGKVKNRLRMRASERRSVMG